MIAEITALVFTLGLPDFSASAVYRPADRAVSNWRLQAAAHIDAPAEAKARILGFSEPKFLPRCVRLNNYWCIKSARWSGEIAADREGHVAFASAREGALVAAQLLRRYYVDLGRKSALAIVSRWAPAECTAAPAAPRPRVAANVAPRIAAVRADGLATRGIGNTLRARWLASHGKSVGRPVAKDAGKEIGKEIGKPGVGKVVRVSQVRSRVVERPVAMMRAPSIAVGMGETTRPQGEIKLQPVRLASLGSSLGASLAPSLGLLDSPGLREAPLPRPSCVGDTARIRNYAAKVAEGVAQGAGDDLKLFDEQGFPTDALSRVMANMASVEIGPMKASRELIAFAVSTQIEALRAKAAASASAERQ